MVEEEVVVGLGVGHGNSVEVVEVVGQRGEKMGEEGEEVGEGGGGLG